MYEISGLERLTRLLFLLLDFLHLGKRCVPVRRVVGRAHIQYQYWHLMKVMMVKDLMNKKNRWRVTSDEDNSRIGHYVFDFIRWSQVPRFIKQIAANIRQR